MRVTVLLAEEGAAYREFAQSFEAEAARKNLALAITQTNSLPADSGLIVAVGIKSTAMALNSHFPVLGVLVSKAGVEKLLHERSAHREKGAFSAIYMDQPSKRQVELVVAALPEAKNIGLLFSAQSTDVAELRKAIMEQKLQLHEQQSDSAETLHRDLQTVLKKSDVLLAIPDAQIYNSATIRHILLETYRSGNPLVGFSSAYIRAGALCAVFSTPEQIATQTTSLVSQFLETGRLPLAQYPNEFDVMVNQQVARSLGIQIRERDALIEQIKAVENAAGEGK